MSWRWIYPMFYLALAAAGLTAESVRSGAAFSVALRVPKNGADGFERVAPKRTGIVFRNLLTEEAAAANRVLLNGSGVAAGDYDGDGKPDLYFCGLNSPNALYRNLGDWRFEEISARAGVRAGGYLSRGAVFADLNGDGRLDLLVSTVRHGVLCFANQGHGRFQDATAAAGTANPRGSTTLTLADVDGNGTLDLYIANNRMDDIRDRGRVNLKRVGNKIVMPPRFKNRLLMRHGRLAEYGEPDQLLLNDGKGRFTPVSWSGGAFLDEDGAALKSPPLDWGLSAAFRDLNGDLAPDLYVCNDFWTPDRVWINNGSGGFRAIDRLALRSNCSSSMGVDFADIDRDGRVDLFVVDMLSRSLRMRKRQKPAQMAEASPVGVIDNRPQIMRNTLFHARDDGTFEEIANFAEVEASGWSWSPLFLDVDLDGYEDLLVTAGHAFDVQDLDAMFRIKRLQHPWSHHRAEAQFRKAFTREMLEHNRLYPKLRLPIVAFRNQGDLRFRDVTDAWGTGELGVHHGIAAADLDGDGDLDLAVSVLNGTAAIYRNRSSAPRIAVRLIGSPPNTQGIGARIKLTGGAVPLQSTEVVSGGRYLSGSDSEVVFAAGTPAKPAAMRLEVTWRDGRKTVVPDVAPNRRYVIDTRDAKDDQGAAGAPLAPALFVDVSRGIAHRHTEIPFDDFARQRLLPFKLSQSGPPVAWYDWTGDGHADLAIGAGRGGAIAAFASDGKGAFKPLNLGVLARASDDVGGLVGWTSPSGGRQLLSTRTGYEAPRIQTGESLVFQGAAVRRGPVFGQGMSGGGALALGDLEGNGTLTLFAGGGPAPGGYPQGGPSRIYRFRNGGWRVDSRNSAGLEGLGIVNGAVWSDLTGDGLPELILSVEWGPLQVFRNQGGQLFEATDDFGLAPYTGLWKGVATGDLNGDGRMDIVAANWGFNGTYQASADQPLVLYYGQLARPGVTDLIETAYDPISAALAPARMLKPLANAMPFLDRRFKSYASFSEASVEVLLGDRLRLARTVAATTLASTVFLNQGSRFRAVEMPREAQLAPAFDVRVADFDGDGKEDVFLSQNFFATQPEVPRLDAGRGLLLLGDGKGNLRAAGGEKTGIRVYGEQRGAAVADFDEDGRADLVVTQNGATTRLFRNQTAEPGIRIRLKGPPGNRDGFGAQLRLARGTEMGPARETHCGSGYRSQDDPVQIMRLPGGASDLWVRWPGGKVTITKIPEDAREITVDEKGHLANSIPR